MARRFLSLKLALLRERAKQLRREPSRARTAAVTIAIVGWLGYQYGPQIWDVLTTTGQIADAEGFLAMQSFALVFTWIATVFSFAGRSDLDVRRFQLLPLTRRQLATGLASTWLLSPGVYLTTAIVVVVIAGFPDGGGRIVLMAAGGIVLVVLCAIAGQLTSSGTGLIARSRRARDFMVLASLAISAVPTLLAIEMWQQFDREGANSAIGDAIGWFPFAWPGRIIASAAAGETATALAFLAASLALIGVCVWGWAAILSKAMLAEDSSTQRKARHGDPFGSFDRRLPAGRRGAAAALELRLMWRDPSRLPSQLLVTVLLGGMLVALVAVALGSTDERLLVFGVAAVPFVVLFRRVNEYGMSSSARWMSAVAGGRASDDLWGRDLANALIDIPLTVLVGIALAAIGGGWLFLGPALIVGGGAILAVYGAMHVVSIRMAKGTPTGKDSEQVAQARQDPLLALAGMFATVIVLAPIIAGAVAAANSSTGLLMAVVPVAVAYGFALWWGSLRWIGGWLDANEADLLNMINT